MKEAQKSRELRVMICGGGTGGHIFPAIAIADAVRALRPDAEILFVGALGRMEMQRVPAAGYAIEGLPICGFDRRRLWRNVVVLWRIWRSERMARRIIRTFRPTVGVGVGGYASGPALKAAASMHIPYLIQEQNSYAGVTNKLLAKKAAAICVAYDGTERFFPAESIILTGNPVRQSLVAALPSRRDACAAMGLDEERRTVLIIGGSLGARTINESVLRHLDLVERSGVQVVWQTGKTYYDAIAERLQREGCPALLHASAFIADMATAYAAADVVVSRAGAGSISELCLTGRPAILVPSPNVAEDHQTKNAMALVAKDAAVFVADADAPDTLLKTAFDLAADDERCAALSRSIRQLAKADAAERIAREVIRIVER